MALALGTKQRFGCMFTSSHRRATGCCRLMPHKSALKRLHTLLLLRNAAPTRNQTCPLSSAYRAEHQAGTASLPYHIARRASSCTVCLPQLAAWQHLAATSRW